MASCGECEGFIKDIVGSGYGMGQCKSYEAGLLTNPSQAAIEKARTARGNYSDYPLFWGGTGKRDCKLFKRKAPN